MENKLTPIEMLDKTLEWFSVDFKDMSMGDDAIPRSDIEHYKGEQLISLKYPELNTNEYMEYSALIFQKLADDGYLTKSDNKYSINFNGKMFSKSGGYSAKQKRESNVATLQSWQTWAIAVGTVLAGIYGLVEILKSLSCH